MFSCYCIIAQSIALLSHHFVTRSHTLVGISPKPPEKLYSVLRSKVKICHVS